MSNGFDPDFHRRDLADAIESGALPQWDLGMQVMPDAEDEMFEGIDLLDPTKLVPEELAPVQLVGTMTLNANPTNYFAETEQVAFNVSNLVPGIDVTDDPVLQARLFSYLDTQITRLGGPNWNQLPINRAHAPINDMLRDGFHQDAVHGGVAPYRPNSLDGGCPFIAGRDDHALIEVPAAVQRGIKERAHPASFDDHFSQVGLFFRSMSRSSRTTSRLLTRSNSQSAMTRRSENGTYRQWRTSMAACARGWPTASVWSRRSRPSATTKSR